MESNEETKRILEMVQNGRLTAAEGARLLETTLPNVSRATRICPLCAETIPEDAGQCPECGSNLAVALPNTGVRYGFNALSGLGKFLVIYLFGVCIWELLHAPWALMQPLAWFGEILAVVGIVSGVLILKGRSAGWTLGMVWAALQIVSPSIQGVALTQQVFHLGINFQFNGVGAAINLVGIVLLVLFIKAKPVSA